MSPSKQAALDASTSSDSHCTMVTPTELPSRAGLTTQG
jgi:hypothetical protein